MKLLKPAFVHNENRPIFSIDIHPKEQKFATGGLGNDSGCVVVWNLVPVLSEKAELDPNIPKILCQMDNHLGCVNAVRWSESGQMLASGADDKLVMIWKKSPGTGGSFGSSGMAKNVENWKCSATLRGHAGDVLDLAWSPQDRYLASCSVDNSIIVWDAIAFPTVIAMLKGHSGMVKGVSWDPVGKFLASQSDDRSLKIWKTSDWTLQNTITEPFEECGGTTHILRLSWSPDGQYLVSAHAMNGGGPTAQIIEREGWKCDKDFVGHRKAVTCVRFNNSILKRPAPKTNKLQQYCCLAIGSRDRCISVWMTALQRPLLVIRDLFSDSILDLSWSHDGYTLLACSNDGTVACLQFNADQLGKPLSEEDKNVLYQRMYGKDATIDISSQAEKEMIIENADLLNAVMEKPRGPPTLIPTNPSKDSPQQQTFVKPQQVQSPVTIPTSTSSSSTTPILKQVETKTKDGKRRITPMFIPMNQDTTATSSISSSSSLSSSSQSKSQIVIEKSTAEETSTGELPKVIEERISMPVTEPLKLDTRLTFRDTPQKPKSSFGDQPLPSPSPLVTTRNAIPVVRMTAGKAQALVGGQCVKIINECRVQIYNDTNKTQFGVISRIVCISLSQQQQQLENKKLWEVVVGSTVTAFSICSKYVIVGARDGSVRLLHIKTGKLVTPILNQASPIVLSAFSPNSTLGGVLTENARVIVWNVDKMKVYMKSSCADILSGNSFINMIYITDHGIPFISTSSGNAYSYSVDLESWMMVNASDPVAKCGLQGSITNIKNMKQFPLATVQYISNSFQQKSKAILEISDNVYEAKSKISFIEHQIELCTKVNSPVELRHWYSMLGFQLASHGTEKEIRQILDDLLGPIHTLMNDKAAREQHKLLKIDKLELLEEVLNNLKTSTKWQRIWTEYQDQLMELKKSQEETQMEIAE